MELNQIILEKLKTYGVGRRKLDDAIFANDKPPVKLGVIETDEEDLCHEVIKSSCNIPGCKFTSESLLEFENHYNASHRYVCGQCKKVLPSPHLLDLHIQETHDSFFAVMAERKPSYCCYVEECKLKFINASERLDHCVKEHTLPKDYRFEQKLPKTKTPKNAVTKMKMDVDHNVKTNNNFFSNSKQKAFAKYTGRKFVKENDELARNDVNMDVVVEELRESLLKDM